MFNRNDSHHKEIDECFLIGSSGFYGLAKNSDAKAVFSSLATTDYAIGIFFVFFRRCMSFALICVYLFYGNEAILNSLANLLLTVFSCCN